MKKILSIILVFAMTISMFAVASFADTNYKQFDSYIAFGDSMTRGLGTQTGVGLRQMVASDFSYRNVPGSYPYEVSQVVGCGSPDKYELAVGETAKYYPCVFYAQNLAGTMDLFGIDDGQKDTFYEGGIFRKYQQMMLKSFACPESIVYVGGEEKLNKDADNITASVGNIRELVSENGDKTLISICLGLADVLLEPMINVIISSRGDEQNKSTMEILSDIKNGFDDGYEYWSKAYEQFIQELKELNPNATLMLVGYFNPLADVTLTDDTVLPVGSISSPMVLLMNAKLKALAKKYDCIYVDIFNAETIATEGKWAISSFGSELIDDGASRLEAINFGVHPTVNGHAYMTRQVLAALPRIESPENPEPCKPSTDIVIDLAKYTSVSQVKVNDRIVKNYSMDGTILTIPYSCKTAINATVAVKNDNGKVAVVSYALSYRDGKYNAYRIVGSNDIAADTKKFVSNVKTTVDVVTPIISDSLKTIGNNIKDTVDSVHSLISNIKFTFSFKR